MCVQLRAFPGCSCSSVLLLIGCCCCQYILDPAGFFPAFMVIIRILSDASRNKLSYCCTAATTSILSLCIYLAGEIHHEDKNLCHYTIAMHSDTSHSCQAHQMHCGCCPGSYLHFSHHSNLCINHNLHDYLHLSNSPSANSRAHTISAREVGSLIPLPLPNTSYPPSQSSHTTGGDFLL